MTVQGPAATPHIIGDFINKVKAFLQNRNDVSETSTAAVANPEMKPSSWIRDALRELTANYPFPELQKPGPLVTVGPGLGWQGSNYMYQVSKFLAPGEDVTLTEDPVIFLAPLQAASAGIAATTGNTVAYGMDYVDPKAIQPLLFIQGGVPFKYTRYGDMYWFGPQPGQNYNIYVPYQVRHPINPDVITTTVRIPPDWYDILCWAAAERGAAGPLRWNEQAAYIHNLLFGDPEDPEKPGLIAKRISQTERDRRLSPMTLQVGYTRY